MGRTLSPTGKFNIVFRVRGLWLESSLPISQPLFSGTSFAINPLELTTLQTITENGQKWTVCVNSIQPQLAVGSSDLDFLLGDIFMRNVYSMCVFVTIFFILIFYH